MWKYILDMGRRVLLLVEDTRRHGEAIKELQREVRELATAVERLAYEVHHVSERTEHQHEVMQLVALDKVNQETNHQRSPESFPKKLSQAGGVCKLYKLILVIPNSRTKLEAEQVC